MKPLLKFAAALAAVLIVAFVGLSFLFDANRFRPILEQQLSQALHRTVTIGDLKLALLSGGVSASDLRISEDPAYGTEPFLAAQSLDIGVDLKALILSQQLHIRAFTVDGADVRLIQGERGRWNFSSLGSDAPEPAAAVSPTPTGVEASAGPSDTDLDMKVEMLRITNSTVHLNTGRTPHDFRDVNFELRNVSLTSAMPFELTAHGSGAGDIKLTGEAGPIAKPDAAETPFKANVEITGLDLVASGFAEPESGIAGLLTVRGEASSTGQTASVTGAVTVDQLKLSPKGKPAEHPVAINLALAHDLRTRQGNIARSELKLGSAVATLRGSYNVAGDEPAVDVVVQGTKMQLQEILAFLPAADVQLPSGSSIDGGIVDLQLAARGPMAALRTAGSVKVSDAKLNYDLNNKLKIIQQLAALPAGSTTQIEQLGAEFQTGPTGTTVKNIDFRAPELGQVTGEGTVSPQHQLDFKMKAVVRTGGAVAAALRQRGQTTTVPFFIRGTSSDPSFSADVKSIANEKLQQAIKNPQGAIDTAKGILNLFKKAPAKEPAAGETK